jgi:hypothetical protein
MKLKCLLESGKSYCGRGCERRPNLKNYIEGAAGEGHPHTRQLVSVHPYTRSGVVVGSCMGARMKML